MGSATGIRLDNQLCVALYDASRAIVGCYRPLLDRIGLTYSQYVVLLVLWERDAMTLRDLGHEVHLDSGTLSPLLKRLEANGVVTRQRSAADERVLEVALTEKGRALYDDAVRVQAQVEEMTGLAPAELAELRDSLQALTARLRLAQDASLT